MTVFSKPSSQVSNMARGGSVLALLNKTSELFRIDKVIAGLQELKLFSKSLWLHQVSVEEWIHFRSGLQALRRGSSRPHNPRGVGAN